jgi:hypothetical protein
MEYVKSMLVEFKCCSCKELVMSKPVDLTFGLNVSTETCDCCGTSTTISVDVECSKCGLKQEVKFQ